MEEDGKPPPLSLKRGSARLTMTDGDVAAFERTAGALCPTPLLCCNEWCHLWEPVVIAHVFQFTTRTGVRVCR